MNDGGKTVNSTTVQNQEPWGPQQSFLKFGFDHALKQLDAGGPNYYPGQTVTDTTAATGEAWHQGAQQARANADLNARTVGGEFLSANNPYYGNMQNLVGEAVGPRNPWQANVEQSLGNIAVGGERGVENPYFQNVVDQIGRSIRPNIDSAFASAGRLGSGSHANAYASALADKTGSLAYQDYDARRNQQLSAANMLNSTLNTQYGQKMQQVGMGQQLYGDERGRQIAASQDYNPYLFLGNIGREQEAKQGQYLADAQARWDYEQNQPANKLAQYMGIVGNRSYGGTTTGTSAQPYTGNSGLQTLGTGLAGLGALGQGVTGLKSLFGF